eukprot:TRINITY_DN3210_c0_g3_i1.p1 TRINITY_DN3210_c0_g3~~TRINITY_DN3210_c0_g3_i1.p1  ORF type:complete len:550 (+),score=147.86 TRINITY_DN3210_c0_g3_i1:50-1699(+)
MIAATPLAISKSLRAPNANSLLFSNVAKRNREKVNFEQMEVVPKPKIKELKSNNVSNDARINLSLERRISLLAKPKKEKYDELMKLKAAQELEEIEKNCSFHPTITSHPIQNRRAKHSVEDRLFREAAHREMERNKLKRNYEDTVLDSYAFTPRINQNTKTLLNEDYKPLHERLYELTKESEKKQHDLLKRKRAEEKPSFHPSLSINTNKYVRNDENVMDRLAKTETIREQKMAETKRRVEAEKFEECTFQPSISEVSRSLSGNFTFEERLNRHYKSKQYNTKVNSLENQETYTFKPKISSSSRAMTQNQTQNVVERLTTPKRKVKNIVGQDSPSFQPEINKRSSAFVETKSRKNIHEHLYNQTKIQKRNKHLLKEKMEKSNSSSFKPDLSQTKEKNIDTSKFSLFSGSNSVMEKIKKMAEEKEQWIAKEKTKHDQDELENCSFEPHFYEKQELSDKPVLVRGLNHYLTRKEKGRQKIKEKEEIENKVFMKDIINKPTYNIDKPQVFPLSVSKNTTKMMPQSSKTMNLLFPTPKKLINKRQIEENVHSQ